MTTNTNTLPGNVHPRHRGPVPLTRALATIPAWVKAKASLDALETLAVTLPPFTDPLEAVAALITDTINGAKSAPADLLTVATEAANRASTGNQIRGAAGTIKATLISDLDNAMTSGAGALADHLNTQLADLISEATDVLNTLGDVRNLDAAIDAGKVTEFRRIGDLQETYEQIRAAQASVFTLTEGTGRQMRQLVSAFIADPVAVDDEYLARITGTELRAVHPNGSWQMRAPQPAPWPDLHTGPALLWLVAHPDAKAWVPTAPQIDAAIDATAEAAAAYTNDQRGHAVKMHGNGTKSSRATAQRALHV